jgi:hypothetical protein
VQLQRELVKNDYRPHADQQETPLRRERCFAPPRPRRESGSRARRWMMPASVAFGPPFKRRAKALASVNQALCSFLLSGGFRRKLCGLSCVLPPVQKGSECLKLLSAFGTEGNGLPWSRYEASPCQVHLDRSRRQSCHESHETRLRSLAARCSNGRPALSKNGPQHVAQYGMDREECLLQQRMHCTSAARVSESAKKSPGIFAVTAPSGRGMTLPAKENGSKNSLSGGD